MCEKFQIFVIPDEDNFGDCEEQLIATFENVCEDFMDDICEALPNIRDIKCRWQRVENKTNHSLTTAIPTDAV